MASEPYGEEPEDRAGQAADSYTAWDGNVYQGQPPAGWFLAGDGRWWPSSSAPAPSQPTPAPSSPPPPAWSSPTPPSQPSPADRPSHRPGCLIGGLVAAVVLVAIIAIGVVALSDDDPSPTAAVDTTVAPASEPGASDSTTAEAPADTTALDPDSQAAIERAGEELATFFGQLPPEETESLCLAWETDPDGSTELWATAYQAIVEQEEGTASTLSEEELSEATAAALSDVCA